MNPIEHIWAFMVKEWEDRNERTRAALEAHVKVMWELGRTMDICEREVDSMARRIRAVREANGGHTKY